MEKVRCWEYQGLGFGFGLILLLIGIYLLGRDLGWWAEKISFWAIFFIVVGAYFIINKLIMYLRNR